MTRGQSRNKGKRKSSLSQTPEKDIVRDGRDIEFSQEFADLDDREALERSKEADRRAKRK